MTEQEYNFNLVARTDGMVTKRAEKQVNTIDCEFIKNRQKLLFGKISRKY